eukprot:6042704-Amphidinium_carterae.1
MANVLQGEGVQADETVDATLGVEAAATQRSQHDKGKLDWFELPLEGRPIPSWLVAKFRATIAEYRRLQQSIIDCERDGADASSMDQLQQMEVQMRVGLLELQTDLCTIAPLDSER